MIDVLKKKMKMLADEATAVIAEIGRLEKKRAILADRACQIKGALVEIQKIVDEMSKHGNKAEPNGGK